MEASRENINLTQAQLVKSILTWLTRNSSSAEMNRLINCIAHGIASSGPRHQLSTQTIFSSLCNGDVTVTDANNQTFLHCCISQMSTGDHNKFQDCHLISTLCKFGASIIADDRDGQSPLSIALTKNRVDLVESLLLVGCTNVTETNSFGQTVLHILVEKYDKSHNFYRKHHDLFDDLITKGADLDKPDNNGVTPVHLLAKSLDVDLLQKFRDRGADLHRRTNSGDNLLILACKNIVDKTVKCQKTNQLVKDSNVVKTVVFVEKLLFYHCYKFDVNSRNNHGFTPLHYVFKGESLSVPTLFVNVDADIHAVANDDTNPLHTITMLSSFEMMLDMIHRGVDTSRRDNVYGFTLIHAAAMGYDERKCEWLVRHGFDPNDLGEYDLTPLYLAAMIGNAKVVKKLIKYGANVNCRDSKFQYSVLHLAVMRGKFVNIQDISGTSLKDDSTSLYNHCFNCLGFETDPSADYASTIRTLLAAGTDPNARDVHGRTPLHFAAKQSNGELVEMLLKAGAQVEVQDDKCFTPLHNCLLKMNDGVLTRLLNFGASINDVEHPTEDILKVVGNIIVNSTGHYIVKHLAKMKLVVLPMNDFYTSCLIQSGFEASSYKVKLVDEVKKMKIWMLAPEVSFHDLLHANFRRRIYFMKNLPDNLEIEFPHYHTLIRGKCNEAINRNRMMESAKVVYDRLTGRQWPDLCVEHVLSFLNNNALRTLIHTL